MVVVGVVLLVLVLAGLVPGQPVGAALGVWLPIMLVAGAAALLYVDHVGSVLRPPQVDAARFEAVPRSARGLALLALIFLGVVWALGVLASESGRRTAEGFIHTPDRQVVLYSAERLALNGPGVQVAPVTQPDSTYRFQYSGLILLAQAPGKFFLLPVGWEPGAGQVFTVPDVDTLRLDLR